MRHISTYISILAISLAMFCLPAQAQKKGNKATEKTDSIPLLRGFAVSADVAGVAMFMVGDYGQYEAALRINLKDRYFPIIELGIGKADHTDDATNLHYYTSAPYGRVGMDFNLLKNKHDIYRLYGGFRLAYTSFKYDISSPPVTDPVWGDDSEYGGTGIKGNFMWIEGVFGVDAKIWGPVHMGWSVRYRSKVSGKNGSIGNAWYVPGFGRYGGSRIGAEFNVGIDI